MSHVRKMLFSLGLSAVLGTVKSPEQFGGVVAVKLKLSRKMNQRSEFEKNEEAFLIKMIRSPGFPRGLPNPGQYPENRKCYVNVVLQVMQHLQPVRDVFSWESADKDKDNSFSSNSPWSKIYNLWKDNTANAEDAQDVFRTREDKKNRMWKEGGDPVEELSNLLASNKNHNVWEKKLVNLFWGLGSHEEGVSPVVSVKWTDEMYTSSEAFGAAVLYNDDAKGIRDFGKVAVFDTHKIDIGDKTNKNTAEEVGLHQEIQLPSGSEMRTYKLKAFTMFTGTPEDGVGHHRIAAEVLSDYGFKNQWATFSDERVTFILPSDTNNSQKDTVHNLQAMLQYGYQRDEIGNRLEIGVYDIKEKYLGESGKETFHFPYSTLQNWQDHEHQTSTAQILFYVREE